MQTSSQIKYFVILNNEEKNYGKRELQELQYYLFEKGINLTDKGNRLEVELYDDTPEFIILLNELNTRGLDYRRLEVREYTKKEIEQTELFHMIVAMPYELDGQKPDYGTVYEHSCPDCDTGLIQKSDLIINTRRFIKYGIATLMPEIIINERLRLLLEEHQITGYVLRPVTDYKNRTDVLLHQLIITNTLPEMSKQIRIDMMEFNGDPDLNPYPCKTCGRGGMTRRSEAIYEREKLTKVCDFNISKEFFGFGMYCVQDIIVT